MRIKLQSFPPLPTIRAWFSIHSATTVKELKSVLCQELPALRDGAMEPQDIILVLDDFDLLEFSPIDVIRDGDLILVKQRIFAAGEKRKSTGDEGDPDRKRVKRLDDRKPPPRPQHVPSQAKPIPRPPSKLRHVAKAKSASSDSDSDSTSSSSSSSESESGSSSDSDSESSSSSSSSDSTSSDSSAPSRAPTRPSVKVTSASSRVLTNVSHNAVGPAAAKDKAPTAQTEFVPPGFGKPATHSRNVRRRRKRMFERLAATVEPASVNEIPLGTRAQTAVPTPSPAPSQPSAQSSTAFVKNSAPQDSRPPVFMMSTLQNKNKKKGFKKMMSSTIPAKIIFSTAEEEAAVEQTLQEAVPFTNAEDREVLATFARLVPPSEKQEKGLLPPNMFVTSIDVEADLPRKNKKKQKQAPATEYEEVEEVVELPYDDPVETAHSVFAENGKVNVAAGAPAINRQDVEAKWTSLSKIMEASQLKPGLLIGWKELGINPQTFTPEMLLNVGKVVSCEQQLVVEQLSEHAAAEVSFGGLIVAEEEQNIELGYDWTDVFQGDWRILQE